MVSSGLHAFLTHHVSNRFGEYPFAHKSLSATALLFLIVDIKRNSTGMTLIYLNVLEGYGGVHHLLYMHSTTEQHALRRYGTLLCSRHHPALLRQTGTGSHLYTAYLHTMRSGLGTSVLLTLMSAALTSSQAPYGSLLFGLPRPRLLYIYYNTLT